MRKAGEPKKPVEKLRGVFWLPNDRGGQVHPDTKGTGDWWIVWKCHHGHRHREKVGPRALARDQYQKRRTQVRLEDFCLRMQKRATPVLFTDLASRWMDDHAKVMKASWATDRSRIETLKGHCGSKYLSEITLDLVERFRTERL